MDIAHDQFDVGPPGWEGSHGDDAPHESGATQGRGDSVTVAAPMQTVRLSGAGIVGLAVGAACAWRTGMFAAFPSAVGLTMLAASDFRTRRIPRDVFAATAASTIGFAAIDAAVHRNGDRLIIACLIASAVAVVAGAIWAATSGTAFGDVKLLTLAAFVPAWLRGSAVLTMILIALIAAVGMVIVERFRAGGLAMKSTIACGPPLLVGWLVGVWTA